MDAHAACGGEYIYKPPDIEQVRAFLAGREVDTCDVAEIGRGEWSVAYGYTSADGERVVRFGATDDDFHKDRIAAAHASPALPIPPIDEIGEAFDGFYASSSRAHGRFLDELGGVEVRAALPAVLAMLDALRLADVSRTSGYGMWGRTGDAPFPMWQDALLDVANDDSSRRICGWREKLASRDGARSFDEAFDAFRGLVADCPPDRHLVHFDLLHRNVLVEDGRINAIIDWGTSLYGDFLYELAPFVFWAPWFGEWGDVDFAAEARLHYHTIGLDVPGFERRLKCYAVHVGLDAWAYISYIEHWDELKRVIRRTQELLERAS